MIGPITHISLCTGYGGLELGLHKALCNLKTIAYCDIELFSCINLMAKMEQGMLEPAPIWSDLKTFPWKTFADKTDLLTGGFPCQPFSTAGKRAADSDPKHLWPYFVKALKELNYPNMIFCENVSGLATSELQGDDWADPKGTNVLLHVLRELERLGYYAYSTIFSVEELGGSQERKRYFILGVHKQASAEFISDILTSITPTKILDLKYPKDEVVLTDQYNSSNAFPQFRGLPQYQWEPPKVIEAVGSEIPTELVDLNSTRREGTPLSKPTPPTDCSFDFESASIAYSSLIDEARLLGNGIVPDLAEKAFKLLFNKIVTDNPELLGD